MIRKIICLVVAVAFTAQSLAFAACPCAANIQNDTGVPGSKFLKVINKYDAEYPDIIACQSFQLLQDDVDASQGLIFAIGGKYFSVFVKNDGSNNLVAYFPTGQKRLISDPGIVDGFKTISSQMVAQDSSTCDALVICMLFTFFITYNDLFIPCLLLYALSCL